MISMLIPASASASKIAAATPGFVFIPAPITETFAMSRSEVKPSAPISRESCSRIGSARVELVLRQRERDVGEAVERGVLDDHADVDPGVGERAERAAGDAGPVGHAADRHLRLAGVVGDARDDGLLEHVLLLDDPRAFGVVERRADVDLHAVVASVLDRAQREDAGAAAASSSISSNETCLSLRAFGTIRGSAL